MLDLRFICLNQIQLNEREHQHLAFIVTGNIDKLSKFRLKFVGGKLHCTRN